MPRPTEHKSVQARILQYAQEIGWSFISRAQAEERRGFDNNAISPRERARNASRFFDDVLFEKVQELNPKFKDRKEELLRKLNLPLSDIYGNRDFLHYLQGEKTFYSNEDKREYNLVLIDYEKPERNVYQVTEEYYLFNGHYANREDVVFLINGIPVLVIECKNATKDEALAIGIDQIRRYHNETAEFFVPQQIFTATESIGFSYGVSWNTVKRNIFNWKDEEVGNLEAKIKSFCAQDNLMAYLKYFIVFAEKDEELNKYILRQHQKTAVEKVVDRAHDANKKRGLIWHTQGSGKTYTMIKAAELLFKAPQSEKPTVLLMIDRNELEDQMMKNLVSVGINNVVQADNIKDLEKLLNRDYRGIIVSMMHKFRDMPEKINLRQNIYVLIDEAHRTTGGDLGNYLMAAIPKASYIGFTGTPVDKTVYGKGTFKTFGIDDEKGYLHKYSIADSIQDGTTLPLFYGIAPNSLLVPKEILEKEFLQLADAQGVNDIEELNKILERAINTKNFLKGEERIEKVAEYIAKHFKENVELMGYKAFLVGVDRLACVKDIQLLKYLFKSKMEEQVPPYLQLIQFNFTDKDTDNLIAHFRDKSIRKEFFKLYKEVEMLYEIISPDAFLRPYIDDYITLSSIYKVVRNAYAKRVQPDREFQRKTNDLVQQKIRMTNLELVTEFFEINEETIGKIKETGKNDNVKVINLVKSIEKIADENSDDPFLIGIKERAQQVEESYEDRQLSTKEALEELKRIFENDVERKKEQAQKGFDGLTFFIYRTILDKGFTNAEEITKQIKQQFLTNLNWKKSEKQLRELRKGVYYAVLAEEDDLDKAAAFVEELFNLLFKAYGL